MALVRRMQECFNTRRFSDAAELFADGYLMHPLDVVGFDPEPWQQLVTQYPRIRVVAEQILVDGDRITACSSVDGCGTPDDEPAPLLIEMFRIEGGRFTEWWGSTWHPDVEWTS